MGRLKRKNKINETQAIIDCHTHILPEVDDGARNMEESMELIKLLNVQGVRDMILTPHLVVDNHVIEKQKKIKEKFKILKEQIKDSQTNVILGYEVMGSERLISVDDYSEYTMGQSKYMMVEANPMASLAWMRELIYELKLQSMQLMIAHVERYRFFIEKPDELKQLKKQGALIQLNTRSISGNNGKTIMKWTKKLIKDHLVDMIGSDCHQIKWRKPEINEALVKLNKWCDEEQYKNIIYANAKKNLFLK